MTRLFHVRNSYTVSTDNKLDARNPMAIVKNYIEEEGLRMLDFFKQMDKDHGGTISKEEFIEGLAVSRRRVVGEAMQLVTRPETRSLFQAVNVPLNGGQIDKLIDMLDKDGDGEIDYS